MKKVALLLLPVLSLFFLYQSVTSYLRVRSRNDELARLRSQVTDLEAKLQERQDELAYRKSADYIYQEALEHLRLTNPGELIVVLPDWVEKAAGSEEESSGGKTPESRVAAARAPAPYWKQWRLLFFGN